MYTVSVYFLLNANTDTSPLLGSFNELKEKNEKMTV